MRNTTKTGASDLWSGIVKIQRCLYPPHGPILIYSEQHDVYAVFPESASPDLLELLGSDLKVYHQAVMDARGILDIRERVEDPGW